jgi:hypothetical protein
MGNIGNKDPIKLDLYAMNSFRLLALLINPRPKLGEQSRGNTGVAWHPEASCVPDVSAGRERREEKRIGLSGATKSAQSQTQDENFVGLLMNPVWLFSR